MKATFLSCILACLVISVYAQDKLAHPLIAEGAELQWVDSSSAFTEGPASDAHGNVYYTDQPNDRILKWSTDGKVSEWMTGTKRANGLYFDHDGNLLACADEKNELIKISPDKEITVLLKDFEGQRMNGPNDVWPDKKGGLYFTDPFYKRDYWSHSEKEIEQERVYYMAPDGSVKIVADDLVQPNGIIGTKNGRYLYVADIRDRKTYKYKINKDGSLSEKSLFVEMGSDGMTLDSKGNLYLTGKGVTVFDKDGEKLFNIPVPQRWTANVTFGGADRKTLFITAMSSLYTLDMNVKGI